MFSALVPFDYRGRFQATLVCFVVRHSSAVRFGFCGYIESFSVLFLADWVLARVVVVIACFSLDRKIQSFYALYIEVLRVDIMTTACHRCPIFILTCFSDPKLKRYASA
jgi:hypothetical protein